MPTRYASEVVIYKHGDSDGPAEYSDIPATAGDLWMDDSSGTPVLKYCVQSNPYYVWEPITVSSITYGDASSYQTVATDLTLDAAAGKNKPDTAFLAPIMGNVWGSVLTKDGNYIGGLIGFYSIDGAGASTYPTGAVLAGIGDGSTDAKGAVVAFIDGDSSMTNAGAAFKVMNNNSVPGSGFDYGLDLYDPARDGYPAVAYKTADIRFSDGTTQSTAGSAAPPVSFSWVVNNPAIGGRYGIKLPTAATLVRITSGVVAGTSVAFNIEERATYGGAGTDTLTADQVAVVGGTEAVAPTGFALTSWAKDSWTYLDISAVTGPVTELVVCVEYTA